MAGCSMAIKYRI